jgi:hypothetical protein
MPTESSNASLAHVANFTSTQFLLAKIGDCCLRGCSVADSVGQSRLQIVLCGPKASGKTVYLTTLFGKAASIRTANDATTQILQADWKRLEHGETWPEATGLGVRELAFRYRGPDYEIDLNINDYDGQLTEVLSAAASDPDVAENLAKFRTMVRSASGLIFLFPFGEDTDLDRMRKFRDEINTFLELVESKDAVTHDRSSIPVVLAVNKWDKSPYFGAPDEVEAAERELTNAPIYRDAVAKLRAFIPNIRIVPVAVQAPSGDARPGSPDPIQPHNLVEPIRYIVDFIFERFEAQYRSLSASGGDQDKAKFILLNQYRKEIRGYKGFGEELRQLDERIGAQFRQEFANLDVRQIDQRMREEQWFFGAGIELTQHDDISRLRRDLLRADARKKIDAATASGADALNRVKQENHWLFEQLREDAGTEQYLQAAKQRVQGDTRRQTIRRGVALAVGVPAAVFALWMGHANFEESSRFRDVQAVQRSADSDDPSAVCQALSDYLNTYAPGNGLRPPLLFAGVHRDEAFALRRDLGGQVRDRVLSEIDQMQTGDAATLEELNGRLNASRQRLGCLDEVSFTEGERNPNSELDALASVIATSSGFVGSWTEIASNPAPSCLDVMNLHNSAASIQNVAQEVASAKYQLETLDRQCWSVDVSALSFRANSYATDGSNPLRFECSDLYDDRRIVEVLLGNWSFPGQTGCSGSNSSSNVSWSFPYGASVSAGQTYYFHARRVGQAQFRSYRMAATYVSVTRDDIYRLRSSGELSLQVPGTSYTIVLRR